MDSNKIALKRHIFKRDGRIEPFNSQKLITNLTKIAKHLQIIINPCEIIKLLQITMQRYKITRMTTTDLSKQVALTAMYCQMDDPDYAILAQHIEITTLHKTTSESFAGVMGLLYNYRHPVTNAHKPLISKKFFEIVEEHGELIDKNLIHKNDYKYNYLSLKILEESYLLQIDGKIVERPQHMLMRVALAVWPVSLDEAFEAYNSLSNHYFVPSHLMLKNAGLKCQRYQTSVALTLNPDGPGVVSCLDQVHVFANVPMDIGIGITEVISENQPIPRTVNFSNGVRGLLQIFHTDYSNISRPIPGPVSFYLEIWHKDFCEYLYFGNEICSNYVNYNVVIPDIFMRRLGKNKPWSFMCPSRCSRLSKLYGYEFDCLYKQYEASNLYEFRFNSSDIWMEILDKQRKSGYPSIIFKDNISTPSNYGNLGSITTSNKYTNFAMHSSSRNPASAHSAYLILPTFFNLSNQSFNYDELEKQVQIVTKFLNKTIDICDYATPNLKRYNKLNRPLAIGVHGLADLFQKLEIEYTEPEARQMNKRIFYTIYNSALQASCDLAKRFGHYPNFKKSPMDDSLVLHIHHWGLDLVNFESYVNLCDKIEKHGVRNSTLISLKTDKTTADIMGVSNSVDPNFSLLFKVEGFGDTFTIMNERLMRALMRQCGWDQHMKLLIIRYSNCMTNINRASQRLRNVFKTASEISPYEYISMASDRAPFVDQSQTTKLYFKNFEWDKQDRAQQEAWKLKLKTIYKVVILNDLYQSIKLSRDYDLKDMETEEFVDLSDEAHPFKKKFRMSGKEEGDNFKGLNAA